MHYWEDLTSIKQCVREAWMEGERVINTPQLERQFSSPLSAWRSALSERQNVNALCTVKCWHHLMFTSKRRAPRGTNVGCKSQPQIEESLPANVSSTASMGAVPQLWQIGLWTVLNPAYLLSQFSLELSQLLVAPFPLLLERGLLQLGCLLQRG